MIGECSLKRMVCDLVGHDRGPFYNPDAPAWVYQDVRRLSPGEAYPWADPSLAAILDQKAPIVVYEDRPWQCHRCREWSESVR